MKRLLTWIVLPPVAVVLIAFAVANRTPVRVMPLDFSLPLYAVVMVAAFMGLVVGAAGAWVGGRKWRRLAREKRRQAERLEAELSGLAKAAPATARAAMAVAVPSDEA